MEGDKGYRAHVLAVPYPSQGHINPLLQFCKGVSSKGKGIKVTLANTVFLANSLQRTSSGSVYFDTISDGYDEGGFAQAGSVADYLSRMEAVGSKTLAELIKKHQNSPQPIDCIVYDPVLPWALEVAKQFGMLACAFFTQTCTVNYTYYLQHHGKLTISSVPGLHDVLEPRDFPSFISVPGSYPAYFEMVLNQFSNTHKADFIFVNTFYKLEQETVDSMSKDCTNLLTIGPTIPSFYLDNSIKDDKDYGVHLFKFDSTCTDWLNTKPAGSVVYVAFGSMANLSDNQMEELAFGLKESGFHFLWVVRPSEEAKLPSKFVEETSNSGQGLVVKWSPQLEVLSHAAVGCFFTHGGWNSTIEALSLGVPMIAMPQWTDQPTNSKLIEDVWKVGVRVKVYDHDHDEINDRGENVNGMVGREEFKRCIRKVMEDEKDAIEMKKNAKKWRELAIEAVSEGGTSDKNIQEFVSKLTTAA